MTNSGTDYGVYGLYRPDGRICYIGKGREDRPNQHFKCPIKHKNKHLGSIITNAGGQLPIRWFAVGLTEIDALVEEVRLIAEIGRSPVGPLVNLTDGGDGVSGLKHSPQTRAKLAALVAGKKQPPEMIAKRVAKLLGMKLPPRTAEQIAKHAAKIRGRKLTDEHRAKIGNSQIGQKRSDLARANMSAAQKGHFVSDEARANMAAAHIGKKQSPELIEKRIAPLRGRKRDPSIGIRVSEAQKGKPKNPDSIAKMIATMKSPEVMAKISGENHWRARRKKALADTAETQSSRWLATA